MARAVLEQEAFECIVKLHRFYAKLPFKALHDCYKILILASRYTQFKQIRVKRHFD